MIVISYTNWTDVPLMRLKSSICSIKVTDVPLLLRKLKKKLTFEQIAERLTAKLQKQLFWGK